MKKLIALILGLSLCFTQTISLYAQDDETTFTDVFDAAMGVADIYLNAGFTEEQLLTLMAILPKEEEPITYSENSTNELYSYYEANPVLLFNPNDYDLPHASTYAGDYSGNPPMDKNEQKLRISFLTDVLNREYAADKYDKGKYMSYLYASHYLENATYDPTHTNVQNFDAVYAHIICAQDIQVFDNFYTIGRNAAIADSFSSMGSMISGLKNEPAKKFAVQTLNGISKSLGGDIEELVNSLNDMGIIDAPDVRNTLNKFKNAVEVVVEGDDVTIDVLTDAIYGQLGTEFPYLVCSYYVNTIKKIGSNLMVASLVSPVLSGVIFYASTLASLITPASLGGLYYTWAGRKTERQLIAYGFHQRP